MYIKIKPLSVNECWQGRRFKTTKYTVYEHEFLTLFAQSKWQPELHEKMGITITVGLSNKKADIDNLLKPILDIMQKKYGFNDNQIYELHVAKMIVDKGNEFVQLDTFPMESEKGN